LTGVLEASNNTLRRSNNLQIHTGGLRRHLSKYFSSNIEKRNFEILKIKTSKNLLRCSLFFKQNNVIQTTE